MTIPPHELQRFNPAVKQSATGLCRTPTTKQNRKKEGIVSHNSGQLIGLFNNNSFQWRPTRQNELIALTRHVTPGPNAIHGVADGDAAHHRHASRRLGPAHLAAPKDSRQETPLASQSPSGRLQEVAPPGAVQQLRENLQRYQPNLRLISPTDDSVINADSVDLVLDVKDWPVSRDLELGLGPHVVVQIDNQPPRQLDELDGNRVHVCKWTISLQGAIGSALGLHIPGEKPSKLLAPTFKDDSTYGNAWKGHSQKTTRHGLFP
jgi:hypothetical protein